MKRRILLLAVTTACLRQTEYHCTSDAECGPQGVCEPSVMFCSFPDATCGRKFGDSAGSYANQCVAGTVGVDAAVDVPVSIDAGIDGLGCPAGYASTGGLPHMYKPMPIADNWMNQSNHCTADGANVYLAIPDDATELGALDTLAAAPLYWVGIDDMQTEGVYVTVRGKPAPYLPWKPGEPDNMMNSDCIAAISASAQLEDDKCDTHYPAICECEP